MKMPLPSTFAHGWTGGQYSVVRTIFGLYLFVHFVHLLPWATELFSNAGTLPDARISPFAYAFPNLLVVYDTPWFATAFVALGALSSIAFAIGTRDRVAAVVIWYVWACLFGRNPLIANPSLAFVGWMLLLHALLPGAPYGSWRARGRLDPAGTWHMPRSFYTAAWLVMAAGYTYSGYTKLISPSWRDGSAIARVLESPLARLSPLRDLMLDLPDLVLTAMTWSTLALELLALPLALIARARPWLWLSLVGLHAGILATVAFADLTIGMLMIHLLTFDPAWIRPHRRRATDHFFYDGSCGLCQRTVRFILAEDTTRDAFRFAPLGGETIARRLAEAAPGFDPRTLPDSVVVVTERGEVLSRSDAVLYAAKRLGGLWRLAATVAAAVPRPVRDPIYDVVAAVRYRTFGRTEQACPLLPAELRRRFDP